MFGFITLLIVSVYIEKPALEQWEGKTCFFEEISLYLIKVNNIKFCQINLYGRMAKILGQSKQKGKINRLNLWHEHYTWEFMAYDGRVFWRWEI